MSSVLAHSSEWITDVQLHPSSLTLSVTAALFGIITFAFEFSFLFSLYFLAEVFEVFISLYVSS